MEYSIKTRDDCPAIMGYRSDGTPVRNVAILSMCIPRDEVEYFVSQLGDDATKAIHDAGHLMALSHNLADKGHIDGGLAIYEAKKRTGMSWHVFNDYVTASEDLIWPEIFKERG